MTVTDSGAPAPTHRRGAPFVPQGPDGYHVGWYPLARVADIADGKVVGVDFLNGRVVVYRDRDGEPRVMSAYCRHLGADLSIGELVGGDLRCAFHHWSYGSDGRCTDIPAGDRIPEDARLFVFPSAERFGLVWAFNGAEPGPLPSFHGHDVDDLVYDVGQPQFFPVEPWTLLTNSMDLQHLRILHGLKIDCDPDAIEVGDSTIDYDAVIEDPNLGVMEQHITVFGTNTIMLSGTMGGMEVLLGSSASPLPNGGCVNWPFAATPRDESSPEAKQGCENRLMMGLAFGDQLLKDDTPVMNTIHFREDLLLPADRALTRFLRYARHFPRANPGGEFLT
jgi:nitrite reductase/ring-hydroxylating ferredoxin subunit